MSDTGCCGLLCSECGAFIATRGNDDAKRAEVAGLWSKQYGKEIKPEDVNCDGCTSGSERLFGHCEVCEIRSCAMGRDVANCAHCGEYPCEQLEGFFKLVPNARLNLDAIKGRL